MRVWAGQENKNLAKVYLPLALFFIANAVTELTSLLVLPKVTEVYVLWPRLIAIFTLPLHLVLVPLFWIYVRELTSKKISVWRSKDYCHFLPALIALCIPGLTIFIGHDEFLNLFERPRLHTSSSQFALIWSIKILEASVIVQVTFYIALILRRLEQHRIELVQLFASTEHLELRWVRWLAVFLIVYAFVSLISAIADNPILLEPWESMIDLALLWFVIAWGLRQKLGLATELAATHEFNQKGDSRYKHSGLTEDQRRAIAKKIAIGMQQANLYRDPGLSLRSLSKHIVELPSYVSQALNQEIGESFFDYVNRWRVEEAKQRLDDSTLTVLAIAEEVGFNSRSSFYNAFKKTTGQTPSAYKKSLRKS